MRLRIAPEALSLFRPLAPCPECQRPLPVPFDDNYEHWPGCWVGAREEARAAMLCKTCGGPCDGPCEDGDEQFEHQRKGNLADAVGKFLTDIFWDETGDGSAVAIFNSDQVNDLRESLEEWCGKTNYERSRTMDQCKLCGTFVPLGDRYCSVTCKRLHLAPGKVIFFSVVLALGLAVSLFLIFFAKNWP